MSSAINRNRRRFLGVAAMAAVATQLGLRGYAKAGSSAAARLPEEGALPPLSGGTDWLNSQPLAASGLRGKVVLVDFWTYTCVDWRRTLPYIRAWAEEYRDRGLVVIGVHTPEFSFEHKVENVRWAIKDIRIDYPVAIDSDYAIWRAFNNEYWPALYLVDAKGQTRYHQFGEGQYEQSERAIQQLLTEGGAGGIGQELVSVLPNGAEVAADWSTLRSPESYVGYAQSQNFASPGGAARNKSRVYTSPARLELNHWALTGDWKVGKEVIVPNQAGGRIAYCFHARDVNLVMGPAALGTSARYRVLLDGQPPGAAHGDDVDSQGHGTIVEQRLYQLIRQPGRRRSLAIPLRCGTKGAKGPRDRRVH